MDAKEEKFSIRLLEWHNGHKLDLPWRLTSDPYRIIVSELLLRRTTRVQVSNVYNRFFSRYPSFEALASASENSLKEIIQPLGMKNIRATALSKLAEIVLEKYHGLVPGNKEQLLELPSVGIYTANAVLCFAFGCHEPLLDTNILRVISRVFSIKSSQKNPYSDSEMWRAVKKLIPKGKAKGFNEAILDFAASVCLARKPKHFSCPLLDICDYMSNGSRY